VILAILLIGALLIAFLLHEADLPDSQEPLQWSPYDREGDE
jgi:hypothetical protein